jgi:hypothetical protein
MLTLHSFLVLEFDQQHRDAPTCARSRALQQSFPVMLALLALASSEAGGWVSAQFALAYLSIPHYPKYSILNPQYLLSLYRIMQSNLHGLFSRRCM